jgi:hypothetical protein
MKTGLDPKLLSHDEEVVRNYVNDPLVHGVASTRFYTELIRAVNETTRDANKLTLPWLIMQGSGDGIVDPSATEKFFKTVASTDKTLKVYEGLYHEVLNEPEKENLLSQIIAWLSARTWKADCAYCAFSLCSFCPIDQSPLRALLDIASDLVAFRRRYVCQRIRLHAVVTMVPSKLLLTLGDRGRRSSARLR